VSSWLIIKALGLTISFIGGIGTSLLTSRLYDKLKGKNFKLTINKLKVEIDREKSKPHSQKY
jgi:hypothetical protein